MLFHSIHMRRRRKKQLAGMWKHKLQLLRPLLSSILLLRRRRALSPSIHTKPYRPLTPYFPANSPFFTGKSFSSATIRCWNCNSPPTTTPFLACDRCRSVQPLDPSVDYFQIFGTENKYDIEDIDLEGKYKEWQKKLHPDLVHSKSEREKEYAAEQSARVIDAYRTLSNPLSRAIYLLKLEGVDTDEEQTVSDPDMLAEILEIREAVEEAVDSKALNRIQTRTEEKLNHWSESFANAFRSKQYEEAQTSIQRMTFYKRVNEEIVKKL